MLGVRPEKIRVAENGRLSGVVEEAHFAGAHSVLAVHTDGSKDVDRAKHIFKTVGAEDISTVNEASAPKV